MSIKESFEKIKLNDFLVEIYGLGYVGFPLAVRLSSNDVKVIGIDVNNERVERLKKEQLMDSELLLKEEFLESRKKGMLKLENKPSIHSKPKIGIVCVPTPIPTETKSSDIFVKAAVENFLEFAWKCAIFYPNFDYLIFDEYSDSHMSDANNVEYVPDPKKSGSDGPKIVGFGSNMRIVGYSFLHYYFYIFRELRAARIQINVFLASICLRDFQFFFYF